MLYESSARKDREAKGVVAKIQSGPDALPGDTAVEGEVPPTPVWRRRWLWRQRRRR